ncbi:hypothetical protein ACFQ7J_10275, partial [Streptomyces sp. NPDC056501]
VCPEPIAAQASVALTSVTIPAQELGRRAVERLVTGLSAPTAHTADDGQRAHDGAVGVELLTPVLTVRDSSGPPAAHAVRSRGPAPRPRAGRAVPPPPGS